MNLISFDYSQEYSPAAPFIDIVIDGYHPDLGSVQIPAFVDSGGDGTLIPLNLLEEIGAEYQDEVLLSGTAGGRRRYSRYTVAISIAGQPVHAIAAVAISGHEVILGRDVLNHFEIRLNGPAAVTEIAVL